MSNKPNHNKKKKFKIWPNMYVMVDPNNQLKQVDYGLNKAVTVRRVKWKPFGKSIWEVADPNATGEYVGKTTLLPEYLLYPLGIVVIRLPADMPIFNEKDMQNLKMAINLIDNIPDNVIKLYLPQGYSKFDKKEIADRIRAVYIKIKHCKELRDL